MNKAEENAEIIDSGSLVDKVEANLVSLLHGRKLKVGDAIPTELELSKSLSVSRTVIREALTRLKFMGLIESRKKKGAVITSPDIFGIMSKSMNPYILDQDTLKEIFEMRLSLEIGMADFIIERVTKKDIRELKEITADEPDLSESLRFQIEHEIRFHGKLYEITGNNTLKRFQRMLLPVFDYVHSSDLFKKDVSIKKYVSHKGLVDIIEHGSAEMLRNGMRNHLENHFVKIFS